MGTLFFAVIGWCGTKYTSWWHWFGKPQPVPWKPQPDPWKYAVLSAIGIIVGIASGLFFNDTVANDPIFGKQVVLASGLFSFAASNIATGLASALMKDKAV